DFIGNSPCRRLEQFADQSPRYWSHATMNPAAPRPIPMKAIDIPPTADEGELGVFDAVNIIVGIVIGTTIFKMAPNIFSLAGSPWGALLVWAIGGLLAFVGAL